MILSMTGYGRATGTFDEKTISVEVRALNAKITDLKLRLPGDYKERDVELRKLITDHAERGKIDVLVEVQNADGAAAVTLNEALFRGYYRELSRLTKEFGTETDLVQAILRIPNVVATPTSDIDEGEWAVICETTTKALELFKKFRLQEGKALESDLRMRVDLIIKLLRDLEPFEQERFVKMRERLMKNLEENFGKENIDLNRFEQEVLYYLEKMDITEEKIRLDQHCKYFLEQLNGNSDSVGRSLGFIGQEMGREINTLGAKAYSAEIQRIIVQMKDELEKIKEQLANVL